MPVAFIVLLSIVVIVFGPLLVIWALNTVFPVLAIPYALKTWFAVIVLGAFISPSVTNCK